MKFLKPRLLAILFLAFLLSGCRIPFTDKEATIPFFEKEPREALMLAYEKMKTVASYQSKGEGSMKTRLELALIERRPLAFLWYNRPRVLGIKEYSESSSPIIIDNPDLNNASADLKKSLSEMLEVDIAYKQSGSYKRTGQEEFDSRNSLEATIGAMGAKFEFNAESIKIGTSTYVKIGKLPLLFSFLGDFDFLKEWILVDGLGASWEALAKKMSMAAEAKNEPSDIEASEMRSKIKALEERFTEEIFKEEYSSITRLSDEDIAGHKSYHLLVKSDPQKLEKLFWKVMEIYKSELGEASLGLEAYLNELKEKKVRLVQGMEKFELEIWIDKKEFLIDRTAANISLDIAGLTDSQGQDQASAKFVFQDKTDYTGYNSEISIEGPKEYKTLSGIFEENMKKMLTTEKSLDKASEMNNDLENIANIKMISTALELHFLDYGQYPSELGQLAGRYLSKIPQAQNYSEMPFQYKQVNGGIYYNLQYSLSADNENYGKAGIIYCANTLGLEQACSEYASSNYDQDGDRVIDSAEKEIYLTDPAKIDTDGDGYPDGDEIIKGYDPTGPGLLASPEPGSEGDLAESGVSILSLNNDFIFESAKKGLAAANMDACVINSEINGFCQGGFAAQVSDYGLCESLDPSYYLISMCADCSDYYERVGIYGNSSYEHCYLSYGLAKNDISACASLETKNNDSNAPQYDPKYTPSSIRTDSCAFGAALGGNDENICSQAGFFMDNCYRYFAESKNDISICDKITGEEHRNDCYKQIAPISDNIEHCRKIMNMESASGPVFYSNMPAAGKGINAETKYVDECMSAYAERHAELRDIKICDLIIGERYKTACITSIAKHAEDIALCEIILDAEYKSNCHRSVAP